MLNRFRPLLDDISIGNDFNKLMDFKAKSTSREFCIKARAKFLAPLLEEVESLSFEDEPNYDMFRFFLIKYLLKAN